MLTLKERLEALKALHSLTPASALPGTAPAGAPPAGESRSVARKRRIDIAAVVPGDEGEEQETPFGPVFHRLVRYPLTYRRGCHYLFEALAVPGEVGGRLTRPRVPTVDLRQAAFLDTETTGLAGGTGTCAFLVGFGHFAQGDGEAEFHLHQYFLRDHAGEPALLWAIGEALRPFAFLVTFNGRRFDWPLLETRFTLARLRESCPSPIHLDLLYPSWALWKRRLGSCRLVRLEEAILGTEREDDVPGWLIPQLYFDYLRSGDARPLAPVLHHNLLDLLSLVSLAAAVGSRLHAPEGGVAPVDLVAVGGFWEKEGEAGTACRCYREASRDGACCREALQRLGTLAKRQGEYRVAEEAWLRLAHEFGAVEALVELAKLYEHQYRDPVRARQATDEALDLIRQRAQRYAHRGAEALAALLHRRERLERKLSGSM